MGEISSATVEVKDAAQKFVNFLNKAVTPFHAVVECKSLLTAAGFRPLDVNSNWDVKPGDKYFVTKNNSTIIAFAVGGSYKPGNGFSIVAAHTDSPTLRIKPVSKMESQGCLQVGVAPYGGSNIFRTWFDRDLAVAGEIVVKENDSLGRRLIKVDKPVLFLPSLAPHLDDSGPFDFDKERHLRPILMTKPTNADKNQVTCQREYYDYWSGLTIEKTCSGKTYDPRDITDDHHAALLDLIAGAGGVKKEDIVDMSICLYDASPATICGAQEEFISGARLDNLVGTYTAVQGLIFSLADNSLSTDESIRIAACFDNEEIGSLTAQGAKTSFIQQVLKRLSVGGTPVAYEESIGKSMVVSCDQAHAVHPNYSSYHEQNHCPKLNGGVVVKSNISQKYASNQTTRALLKQVAFEANVPLQDYLVPNHIRGGGTIGSMLSANLGVRTVDVGCAQLAMHSIRELGDTSGIYYATKLYAKFYQRLPAILSTFQ